jgi:YfiH family protein
MVNFISPNWQAPDFIKAFTTCQSTETPTVDYNVCLKNSRNSEQTLANRRLLHQHWQFKHEPAWLDQIHSNLCISIPESSQRVADASFTNTPNQPLVILTADCLPILIAHRQGTEIAAIHAGWKGLYHGIIERTMDLLSDTPEQYMVWFGPAICQNCYPVDETFKHHFIRQYPNAKECFKLQKQWHFSLTQMSEVIFRTLGTTDIYHSHQCTYEQEHFYSYRRDQGQTGRIATFIWIEEPL